MWRFEASHRRATPKGQNLHLLHSTTSRSSTYIEPLSCARGTRSFSNSVSSRDAQTCDDATCLTRCHLALVSNPCHFSRDRIRTLERLAAEQPARSSGWLPFRHVTCGGAPPAQFRQRRLSLRPPRLFVKCDVAVGIALIRSAARTSAGWMPATPGSGCGNDGCGGAEESGEDQSCGGEGGGGGNGADQQWAAGVICIIRFA